jgi:hypothetical protein
MKLEEYLARLEVCPADKLTEELGIYDNWPVLLNAGHDSVLAYFRESQSYRPVKSAMIWDNWHEFDFLPSPALLRVCGGVALGSTTCFFEEGDEEEKHTRRQMESYNVTLMLFPRIGSMELPGAVWKTSMVPLVQDVGRMIFRSGFPACFPRSVGWKPGDISAENIDTSRIVYFP